MGRLEMYSSSAKAIEELGYRPSSADAAVERACAGIASTAMPPEAPVQAICAMGVEAWGVRRRARGAPCRPGRHRRAAAGRAARDRDQRGALRRPAARADPGHGGHRHARSSTSRARPMPAIPVSSRRSRRPRATFACRSSSGSLVSTAGDGDRPRPGDVGTARPRRGGHGVRRCGGIGAAFRRAPGDPRHPVARALRRVGGAGSRDPPAGELERGDLARRSTRRATRCGSVPC